MNPWDFYIRSFIAGYDPYKVVPKISESCSVGEHHFNFTMVLMLPYNPSENSKWFMVDIELKYTKVNKLYFMGL